MTFGTYIIILLAIGSSASGEVVRNLQEKGFGKIYLCEDWESANDAVKEQVFCDYIQKKSIDLSGEYIDLANHKILNPLKHPRVYRQMLTGTFFSEIIVPGMYNDDKYGNLQQLDEIKSRIGGAKCVLDIGACAGLFSIMVSGIAENVWAFEPSEAIRFYLIKNTELCGNVHVESFGILNEKGKKTFYDVSDYPKYSGFVERDGAVPYQVMTTNVDYWCEDMGIKPDVIRIDATDCLVEIMDGAKNTIKEYDPVIIIGTKIVDV
ncbi:methyltransferase, FkbM family [Butyrivibrio sp. INlla16]|nr:methyltransferase, FkbM family [Butyrivibrio sp. INlla16]